MLHAEEINKSVLNIYDAVRQVDADDDIDATAAIYIALNEAKRELAEMFDKVKDRLIEQMGNAPEVQFEDFVLERKNGSPRKSWSHQTLGELVAQRLIDLSTNMDTGELTRSPIEIAVDMLTYAAPSYWRVTELGKIGINADNYCEVGEAKSNIIIRKAS